MLMHRSACCVPESMSSGGGCCDNCWVRESSSILYAASDTRTDNTLPATKPMLKECWHNVSYCSVHYCTSCK